MAKTIEAVRRPVFKEDVLHNHIAETYFRQKTRAKSRKKKHAVRFNIDLPRIFIIAAIIAVLSLLLTMSAVFLHKRYIGILQKKTAELKVINVISRGSVNKTIIEKFEFRGIAKKGNSDLIKDTVILINPKKYNRADISIDFKFPIDLSHRSLMLSMRGNNGGEKVAIVLRDTKNRSYRLSDVSLSSVTQDMVIRAGGLSGNIDLVNVNHIRIECGKPGESVKESDSSINVTVYVNNLSLIKES